MPFHKWKGIWIYKGIFKLVPIPKKKAPSKKTIVMKHKNEKGEKVEKNWVDDEILHLIDIREEMEPEFVPKKK